MVLIDSEYQCNCSNFGCNAFQEKYSSFIMVHTVYGYDYTEKCKQFTINMFLLHTNMFIYMLYACGAKKCTCVRFP